MTTSGSGLKPVNASCGEVALVARVAIESPGATSCTVAAGVVDPFFAKELVFLAAAIVVVGTDPAVLEATVVGVAAPEATVVAVVVGVAWASASESSSPATWRPAVTIDGVAGAAPSSLMSA
jgi:hypothetical protein